MAIAIALPVVAGALPPAVRFVAATVPVTVRVVPSKVKLPLSSSSPEAPAITTRLSVRSPTLAVVTSIPPLASIAPVNVERPTIVAFLLTFKSVLAVTTPTESTLVTSS